jgi:hypothetical protein
MNEIIKSLAMQSGVVEEDVDWENAGGDLLEKFAHLIVEDCAYIADKNHSLGVTTGNFMKRYFGVEE